MAEFWVFLGQFVATFAFIFLRAFQQRNVAFDHYWWIIPTSFLMAITEVFVISNIATIGWDFALVFAMGAGGGTGSLAAALVHKRFLTKKG